MFAEEGRDIHNFVKARLDKVLLELKKWPIHVRVEVSLGAGLILSLVLIALLGGFIYPYDPFSGSSEVLQGPSFSHVMGTDQLGRDVCARIIEGAKYSMVVALVSVLISFVLGVPLGCISGYQGGKIDRALTMFADAFWGFPTFILAILLAWILGPSPLNTALAVGVAVSPSFFRVVRSETLSLKEWVFVEAELSLGASRKRIIFLHIFPNTLPSIIVLMTLGIGRSIVAVSGLGFLGLGLSPPIPEWGTDLGRARFFLSTGVWWSTLFPSIMIFLAVLAFHLLGEGMGTLLKPKVKSR